MSLKSLQIHHQIPNLSTNFNRSIAPPMRGYRTKEQARKKKHDVNTSKELPPSPNVKQTAVSDSSSGDLPSCPSYVSPYEDTDDEAVTQPPPVSVMRTEPPPLSVVLTSELERAVSAMSRIPVPGNSERLPKPPKQVLGLPCPKVWKAMQDQNRGVHKTMPEFKGKGKRKLD